jgi:hypothetical protein
VLFNQVVAAHYRGDDRLERGVLAELQGKPDPRQFRRALEEFQTTARHLATLDKELAALQEIHKQGKEDPAFAEALTRILRDAPALERVSLSGRRYSNVARDAVKDARPKARSLAELMSQQREDLGIVRKQLDETIVAFRQVLPLADRGEFAALILSGRQGFSDKIQQSVDMIGTFSRSYTRGCSATIDATMQIYPKGLGWLRRSQASK